MGSEPQALNIVVTAPRNPAEQDLVHLTVLVVEGTRRIVTTTIGNQRFFDVPLMPHASQWRPVQQASRHAGGHCFADATARRSSLENRAETHECIQYVQRSAGAVLFAEWSPSGENRLAVMCGFAESMR